ncbi:MAG: plasmid pRiA4b ORF-3 family protein [Chloroflexia bacterium]|nr:plasmid pRiA4b ORF-3 family protein [Chloroflexia bacterium]
MKNTENIKFKFPEKYWEVIENSSIVPDFDKFIEMATNGQLELTKNNVLSMASAKIVNENIVRKIPMQLARPAIKSFPNVLSLFILFRLSGLGKVEIRGEKRFLKVKPEMLEQWNEFTNVDKYFYLFSLTFSNFSFEPIGDGDGVFQFGNIIRKLASIKRNWKPDKFEVELFFESYKYKTIFMAFDMFGLIKIEDAAPIEKQGWNILSVQSKSFTKAEWEVMHDLIVTTMFADVDIDNEPDNDYSFSVEDIEEVGRGNRFADKITEIIPEFRGRLKIELENRTGIHYFRASLGKVWRILKIDSRNSLDHLCNAVLEAFDFDYEHLYDVKFTSTFGYDLTFNGAPDITYAEYPTTEDITIGKLPIHINDEMVFTYDYGDYWQFTITFEKIEPLKNHTKKIPDIELLKSNGDAPEQYPGWDD